MTFLASLREAQSFLVIAGLLLSAGSGCRGCKDDVIQSERVGKWDIALHHRVCGSVAGYAVSIAPPGADSPGYADQYEPFLMDCDCYKADESPPIELRVQAPNTIIIKYDMARVWAIPKRRARQGPFTIIYQPFGSPRDTDVGK
jgi:hypothetical protein